MRHLRATCWMIIAILLLNGSGVVSSLHKIVHHAGDDTHVSHCDHDADHSEQSNEKDDLPVPQDEGCEICLGLAGLNLIPVEEPLRVVTFANFTAEFIVASHSAHTRDPLGECPARAPPVC